MKYLSVCSGIEAASVAWHPLGWTPLAFSEIEPFPRAVLQHHYPQVPLHGDFTVLRDQPWIVDADVLVGGTPCQAFSVAGLRNSLADERGNLSLEYVRLADAIDNHRRMAGKDSAIVVWENVPGVLSVKDNAFGCFLAALAGESAPLVPPRGKWTNAGVVDGPQRQVAWRVLDAQYFGLAQRRRRVFVVASARDGFDPAAVLLEFEGVRRDTPPRREAGQAASGGASGRAGNGGVTEQLSDSLTVGANQTTGFSSPSVVGYNTLWRAGDQANAETLEDMAGTLNCNKGQQGGILFDVTHSLRAEGFDASETGKGDAAPCVAVAFHTANSNMKGPIARSDGIFMGVEPHPSQSRHAVFVNMAVRRLTPVECERLQGFPDNYTNIPWKKKPAADCPDGPRYKALGNSMAVPVMRWIGQRIANAIA